MVNIFDQHNSATVGVQICGFRCRPRWSIATVSLCLVVA